MLTAGAPEGILSPIGDRGRVETSAGARFRALRYATGLRIRALWPTAARRWVRRGRRLAEADAVLTFLIWCVLFVLCWPLAVLALILWPVVWLISLPFRLVGITLEAVFALLRAALFLPARLLGDRRDTRRGAM
jgi:hypothetical protein